MTFIVLNASAFGEKPVQHPFVVSPSGQEIYNDDITRWFAFFGGLTCLANIYAVVAIALKAW